MMTRLEEALVEHMEDVQDSDITFGIDHEGFAKAILASPEMQALKKLALIGKEDLSGYDGTVVGDTIEWIFLPLAVKEWLLS
jgi:hypothetical protein